MSATALPTPASAAALHPTLERFRSDPAYQAYTLLRIGFAVLPIVFGIDKFANVLVNWEQYLAPWINDIVPGSATSAMYAVGVVEIRVPRRARTARGSGQACPTRRPRREWRLPRGQLEPACNKHGVNLRIGTHSPQLLGSRESTHVATRDPMLSICPRPR